MWMDRGFMLWWSGNGGGDSSAGVMARKELCKKVKKVGIVSEKVMEVTEYCRLYWCLKIVFRG